MSLLVWLPMTKDLTQQGISDITVTNNGATLSANGKLGKCYYFDGNDYIRISLPSELTTIKNTTVCAWIKSTGSVIALGGISNDTNYANAMVTLYTSGWQFSGSGAYKYLSSGLTANDGIWHHVVCTIDDTTITTYKDGAKVTSTTLSSLGVTVTDTSSANFIENGCVHPGGHEYLTGYVNDFRIYNHALSPKEVELLSRGLVCHYPLNGNGRGGDNIMPNSYVMNLGTSSAANGVWRLAGTNNMNRSRVQTDDGFYAFENSGIQTANDGSCYGIDSFVFEANTTYTMSMIARITEGTEGYAGFSPSNVTVIGGTHTKYERYYYVTPLTTTWRRIYIIFTTGDSTTRNIYIGVTTGSTSVTTQMALVKIEKGEIATPWMPNSADTAYTAMGYDSLKIYDTSGYKYNSTLNSATTYTSNSARYSVATYFGVVNTPRTSLDDTSVLPALTKCTVTWWEYCTNSGATLLFTGDNTNKYIAAGSTTIMLYDSSIGTSGVTMYRDGVQVETTQGSIVYHPNVFHAVNEWHHFALTGINIAEWNQFHINGYSSAWPLRAYLSDVRIYATVLTEAQVAELYNTAVSVANNGTLMGYELVEV